MVIVVHLSDDAAQLVCEGWLVIDVVLCHLLCSGRLLCMLSFGGHVEDVAPPLPRCHGHCC